MAVFFCGLLLSPTGGPSPGISDALDWVFELNKEPDETNDLKIHLAQAVDRGPGLCPSSPAPRARSLIHRNSQAIYLRLGALLH